MTNSISEIEKLRVLLKDLNQAFGNITGAAIYAAVTQPAGRTSSTRPVSLDNVVATGSSVTFAELEELKTVFNAHHIVRDGEKVALTFHEVDEIIVLSMISPYTININGVTVTVNTDLNFMYKNGNRFRSLTKALLRYRNI